MNELPLATLAAEYISHPQTEWDGFVVFAKRCSCPLQTHPVRDVIARPRLKDLEMGVAIAWQESLSGAPAFQVECGSLPKKISTRELRLGVPLFDVGDEVADGLTRTVHLASFIGLARAMLEQRIDRTRSQVHEALASR